MGPRAGSNEEGAWAGEPADTPCRRKGRKEQVMAISPDIPALTKARTPGTKMVHVEGILKEHFNNKRLLPRRVHIHF